MSTLAIVITIASVLLAILGIVATTFVTWWLLGKRREGGREQLHEGTGSERNDVDAR